MNFEELLKHIDGFLSRENLKPEQQDELYRLRGFYELQLEREAQARSLNAFSQAFRRAWEMQNPNLFLGERLLGGPREIPGWQGGGIDIAPQVVPGGQIRDFVPNTSFGDRMNINLKFLTQLDPEPVIT